MIEVVSATRRSADEFWNATALGISLQRLNYDRRLAVQVAVSNSVGLPAVYNSRISPLNTSEILLFIHDDVWIEDFFLGDRVIAGLQAFDVIGVAGNRRRMPGQRAWHYISQPGDLQDPADISGAVAHGQSALGRVTYFGRTPAECDILDGVFLAARLKTLLEYSVRFDPLFDFHFYDLDFCRSARQAGLRLGTWPICLTHQSGGAFESPAWTAAREKYLRKWGD